MLDRIYQVLPNRQLIIIGLVFFHLLLAIVYFISDSFTGTGFDESVIYFLHTGVDGFETAGYRYLIISTALLIVLCLYVCTKLGKSRYLNHPANTGKTLGINFALITLLFSSQYLTPWPPSLYTILLLAKSQFQSNWQYLAT